MSTVLITGCSTGFGRLAALEFARQGDKVYASMRDTNKGRTSSRKPKPTATPSSSSSSTSPDRDSANAAVDKVIAAEGGLDVLVNNAGVGTHGPIEEYDDDEVDGIFDTNVLGVIRVTRAALPQMRKQGSGAVINVSSLAGKVTGPFQGVYSASKHALEAISDALYYELQPFGVRVVVIEPGGFETAFGANRQLARRFTEGSPYAAREQAFAAAMERLPGRGEGPPPTRATSPWPSSRPRRPRSPSAATSSARTPRPSAPSTSRCPTRTSKRPSAPPSTGGSKPLAAAVRDRIRGLNSGPGHGQVSSSRSNARMSVTTDQRCPTARVERPKRHF